MVSILSITPSDALGVLETACKRTQRKRVYGVEGREYERKAKGIQEKMKQKQSY